MAAEKLYDSLEKAKKALEFAIDNLDDLSKNALDIGGEIARVITSQAQANIDLILDVIQGAGQNSIENLIDYLDAVPLKATRPEKASSKYLGSSATSTATINTTPDVSNGPQSALMKNESIDLSEYYKKNFVEKIKKLKESDFEPNWDSIRSNELFVNSCDLGEDFNPDNFSEYIPGVDDGLVEIDPLESEDDAELNDYSEMPEMAQGEGHWEQAAKIGNPDLNPVNQPEILSERRRPLRKNTEKDFVPEWDSIKEEVNSKLRENHQRENDYSRTPELLNGQGSWEQAFLAANGSTKSNLMREIQDFNFDNVVDGFNIQDRGY